MEKNKVFFISDTHFHHQNILYFKPKRRALAGISLEELRNGNKEDVLNKHDKWLINLWNEQVGRQDSVYILGDFCLGNKDVTEKILHQLHGKKYLILGNHDKSCKGLENYFEWVGSIKEAKFNHDQYPFIREGETFCVEMCHFPMITWNRRPHGSTHLHGHCHGSTDCLNDMSKELRLDVGLDGNFANYHFPTLEDVYRHFRDIIAESDSKSFEEHTEKLMEKLGFRA